MVGGGKASEKTQIPCRFRVFSGGKASIRGSRFGCSLCGRGRYENLSPTLLTSPC